MKISRTELNKIQETLNKFPDVQEFKIIKEGSSGIGNILSIMFNQEVNGVMAAVQIEISGVEDWQLFILILITSLKAQFHHQIELHTIQGLKTENQCQTIGKKLSDEFKHLNADMDVKIMCEEGKQPDKRKPAFSGLFIA